MGKCFTKVKKQYQQPQNNDNQNPIHKSSVKIIVKERQAMQKDNRPQSISDKIEKSLKEQYKQYNYGFAAQTDWVQLQSEDFQLKGSLYAICNNIKMGQKPYILQGETIIYYSGTNTQSFLIAGKFKHGKICQKCNEKYIKIYGNGNSYIGQLNYKFEQDGFGRSANVNKTYEYEGYYNSGIPHGQGKMKKNEKQFEGVFRGGQITQGKQKTQKGWYKGTFSNSMKNGHGQLVLNHGYRYVGEFKNGYKEGHGILYKDNRIQYEGQWKNDCRVKS